MIPLDWTGEKPFATLGAENGRDVELVFKGLRQPMECVTCGHSNRDHEWCLNLVSDPCRRDGCKCTKHVWAKLARPEARTEVRFYGLARIANGTGSAAARRRWNRNQSPRRGFTTCRIQLYSTTFAGLVQLATHGLRLRLVPSKKEHKPHGTSIAGAELARLSVAIEAALERGEWAPDKGFASATAQDELCL